MQQLMDRALKERIIGAIVLVLLAILVVPVFLDGPSDDNATVQQAVSLPGQNQQDRKTQTIVLERDRTEPVPAANGHRDTAPTKDDSPSGAARKKQLPTRLAAATITKGPAGNDAAESSTGMWAVQLGSFSKKANAEKLAAELRNQGYAAFLSRLKTSGGALHRVRVGPQKDRDSAESVAARLGTAGHNGQVVPHP